MKKFTNNPFFIVAFVMSVLLNICFGVDYYFDFEEKEQKNLICQDKTVAIQYEYGSYCYLGFSDNKNNFAYKNLRRLGQNCFEEGDNSYALDIQRIRERFDYYKQFAFDLSEHYGCKYVDGYKNADYVIKVNEKKVMLVDSLLTLVKASKIGVFAIQLERSECKSSFDLKKSVNKEELQNFVCKFEKVLKNENERLVRK